MDAKIIVLPGDGIGPEVTAAAQLVLQEVSTRFGHNLQLSERLMGGCAIDRSGRPITDETLADCVAADAVLLGAVGGPKWDDPRAQVRPEQGLLALRKGLGVFANLRPVRPHPRLLKASPLKRELLRGVDLLVVRELTGGVDHAHTIHQTFQQGGIVQLAFKLAAGRRSKVTSVDKANILDTSRMWRAVATKVGAQHPHIALDHQLVDTAAMRLVAQPAAFDVVVTENMFGDILTDEAAVLTGSMGNLPSASLSGNGPGLYEPIHGSAPDIAGKGIANPIGAILSAALLLRHSLQLEREAVAVERAVDSALRAGCRTADLQPVQALSTMQMAAAIVQRLPKR